MVRLPLAVGTLACAVLLSAPTRHLALILLTNTDGLNWDNGLDEAAVHRSPFVAAFLEAFPR